MSAQDITAIAARLEIHAYAVLDGAPALSSSVFTSLMEDSRRLRAIAAGQPAPEHPRRTGLRRWLWLALRRWPYGRA